MNINVLLNSATGRARERQKLHNILSLKEGDARNIDANFDRARKQIVEIADKLNAYKIDLSSDDDITGRLAIARIAATGTPSSGNFLRGDGAWVSAGGEFLPRYDQYITSGAYTNKVGTVSFGVSSSVSGGGQVSDANGNWQRLQSAVSGTVCSWSISSGGVTQNRHNPIGYIFFRTGASVANIRIWALLNELSTQTNSDTLGNQGYGFRFSTVAGDTGWVGVARDSGGGQSVTPMIKACTADTNYRFKIAVSGAGTLVTFTINDDTSTAQSLSTNMPPAASDLRPGCNVIPQTGANREIYAASIMVLTPLTV